MYNVTFIPSHYGNVKKTQIIKSLWYKVIKSLLYLLLINNYYPLYLEQLELNNIQGRIFHI